MVKEGIVYQRIAEVYKPPMVKQSIQIQLSRMWWATIHNLFAAPIRGQALAHTGGDLNAHSPLWDEPQLADQRGELVED